MRIRDRSRADTIAAASRPTPIPRTRGLAARERTKEESSSGRRQRSTAEHEIPRSNNERAEPRRTDGRATSEHEIPKGHNKARSAGPRRTIPSPRARGRITERRGVGDRARGQGARAQPGKGAPSKVRRRTGARRAPSQVRAGRCRIIERRGAGGGGEGRSTKAGGANSTAPKKTIPSPRASQRAPSRIRGRRPGRPTEGASPWTRCPSSTGKTRAPNEVRARADARPTEGDRAQGPEA